MGLTGRFDFRRTWTGKIVLYVEEEVPALWPKAGEHKTKKRWRKATLMDLTTPEMRALMDLRMRPQYMTHHVEVDRPQAAPPANVVTLPTAGTVSGAPSVSQHH